MVGGGNPTSAQLRRQILELEYHGLLEIAFEEDGFFGGSQKIRVHDLHNRVAEISARARPDAPFKHVYPVSPSSVLPSRPQLATYKYVYGWFDNKSLTEVLESCPRNLRVLWLLEMHGSGYTNTQVLPTKYSLNGGSLVNLRILRIEYALWGGSDFIEELGGWQGVPNLVSLGLTSLRHLKRVGDMGCLKKLESLKVKHCQQLQVRVLVSNSVAAPWHAKLQKSVTTWLVKAGDELPNLRILTFSGNDNLVEVGPLSKAFPSLQTLDLGCCGELRSFPGGVEVGSSLRILRLADCAKLKRMEGSTCPLTALEELDLARCHDLKWIPDLTELAQIKILRFSDCTSLLDHSVIKLHEVAVSCSLQELWLDFPLQYNVLHGSASTSTSDGAGDDTNIVRLQQFLGRFFLTSAAAVRTLSRLKRLYLELPPDYTDDIWRLHLSGLPVLEILCFGRIRNVKQLFFNDAVELTLISMGHCPSLEELCGLGAQHLHLSNFCIDGCASLKKIWGLGLLPALKCLVLRGCDSLAVDGVQPAAEKDDIADGDNLLPISLEEVEFEGLRAVTDFSFLEGLSASLYILKISHWERPSLPNFQRLTSLQQVEIRSGCKPFVDAVATLLEKIAQKFLNF